jgi:hypothetical protein
MIRPLGEPPERRLVVVDAALLVGVDEDEVARATAPLDHLERGTEVERNSCVASRLLAHPLAHRAENPCN